mgnify:CR=1 FL=1
MSEEKEFILSKDGKKLCVHIWDLPDADRVLCLVHGLGEHAGRYAELAHYLNQSRISAYALDMRGHGLSDGKRGHAAYEDLQSDIEELLKYARAINTDAKLVLMGHSFGGNQVAHFVKHDSSHELAGFILSSPFLDVAFQPPKWKVTMANLIGSLLPSLTQSNELDATTISRDSKEVEKYLKDPLVHDQISVRMYLDVTKAGRDLLKNTKPLRIKGLAYHGDADKLVSFAATNQFVSQNEGIQWHPLADVYHEPHNDFGKEKVYALVSDFILSL